MAKETQIGQLVIDLKIKTEALEKGLETAKKKLEQIENQNKQVESSNKELDASFIAMSASIVASLMKITSAIGEGVDKYNSYVNSMNALQKTAKATDNSMSDIQDTIKDVNKLKLMDESDLNSAIKNLLLYGYTAEQTADILKVLQDAAVGNRQANYSLSEAVRVTTEGIRMENSVLSDAAGVQKNISKMYEEYASKIGKSTDALTQAEKAQAVYNGIMNEASMFTGAAQEMASTYQGQQAQLNATNLELSRTIGESMIPTLTQYNSIQLSITQGLSEFISNNKSATSGIITFTTTLLAMVLGLTAAKKGYVAYKTAAASADMTTKAFTASLMANPVTLIAVGIASVVAGLSVFNTKMQESIDKMNEETEASKNLSEALGGWNEDMEYSKSEESIVKQERDNAQQIVQVYEEKKKKIEDIENQISEIASSKKLDFIKNGEIGALQGQLKEAQKELEKFEKENLSSGKSIESYKRKVEVLTKTLDISASKQEYLTKTNVKSHRETLINIAQTKADIDGKQKLLNILKKGKTTTDEYADAKSQLVKVYPELANVNENTINSTQALIDQEDAAAQAEWALAQSTILNSIAELSAMQANDEKVQQIAMATQQKVEDVRASIEAATNSLVELSNLSLEDFKGSVTTNYTPKVTKPSGSKSYSNKVLDNYKKEIEYKKSLDKLSLKEEIKMYETALKKYAKTTDEKRELITKIYELNKELNEAELNDYTGKIEYKKSLDKISLEEEIKMYETALKKYATTAEEKNELRIKIYELNKEMAYKEKEILNQQTEDYEAYIQKQRNAKGASYDVKEQQKDYDKIIKIHQKYLKEIMKDERLSLEERKQIYREELQIIRDYEQQKRDLRVEQIDNTVTQLTNAIKKQLEEMQEKDKEMIDANIEEVEKWKEIRINAINEEYDARIEAINKELEALDKAEQQKIRNEEDTEYERKKQRLQELVDFEHDATTKANYQKELNKLIAEYQETLNDRALEDKKEALNTQKDLLQQEQDEKVQVVENETEKQKEIYEKQLDSIEEYYENQINSAQETAEKMLLNVEDNQKTILNLLKNYGDDYEITGQTLGEKLAQGINNGLTGKIENVIKKIQESIDKGIESKIGEMTSGTYKYTAGSNKPTVTNVTNVTQQNYIQQMQEMPSETYRKLNDVSQKLAAELSM